MYSEKCPGNGITCPHSSGAFASRDRHILAYQLHHATHDREVMSYSDFPMAPAVMRGLSVDGRTFCGHEEVRTPQLKIHMHVSVVAFPHCNLKRLS